MEYIFFDKSINYKEWSMDTFDTHSFYEFYFLFEGNRTLIFDDKIYNIKKNTLAIIPPFLSHKTDGGGFMRINVYASPNLILKDFKFIDNTKKQEQVFYLDENQVPFIKELLLKAVEVSKYKLENSFEIEVSFLNTILFNLQQSNLKPHEYVDKTPLESEQLNALVNYINQHYNERLTLDFLCKKFYYTKSNLYRKFKENMGCTLGDYISFVRFNKAKERLFITDDSIEKIAEDCGFSSLNYFSLIFKRKVGVSPTEFRKKR